jgi:hypothetical protein
VSVLFLYGMVVATAICALKAETCTCRVQSDGTKHINNLATPSRKKEWDRRNAAYAHANVPSRENECGYCAFC